MNLSLSFIHRTIGIIFLAGCLNHVYCQSRQAIINVTIIDVTSANVSHPSMTVMIENGKITKIGPFPDIPVPKDVTVINGKDKFLIPGLWDMHTHLSYFGEDALRLLVGNGVTGVRDMGGDITEIDSWRKEIANGTRIGPRIFRAGPFVDGPKNMDAKRASFTRVITSGEEGRQIVKELDKVACRFY